MPRQMIELTCPICGETYLRDAYEAKRNARLGRRNVHNRACQATYMNRSDKKQEQTKQMLAERNSHQYRIDNPNWKGGVTPQYKLKDVPEGYVFKKEGNDEG